MSKYAEFDALNYYRVRKLKEIHHNSRRKKGNFDIVWCESWRFYGMPHYFVGN